MASNVKLSEKDIEIYLDMISFYRRYPVYAAKDIFGIDLSIHQGLMLKSVMHDYVESSVLFCGRGISKSFIIALAAALIAVLYTNEKILLVGSGFRQSKEVMLEVERIFDGGLPSQEQVRFAKECVRRRPGSRGIIEKSPDAWRLTLTNGSYILAVPTSVSGGSEDVGGADKIRGYRASRLMVDEVKDVPRGVIDRVLRPMGVVDMDPVSGAESRANQIVFSGTIDFEVNHYWEMIQRHQSAANAGDKKHSFVQFTYPDTVRIDNNGNDAAWDPPYKMKVAEIERLLRDGDIPEEVWLSEYRCVPIRNSGNYYPYNLMHDACEHTVTADPEYDEYLVPKLADDYSPVAIGIDVGRVDDWSAITVVSVNQLAHKEWDYRAQMGKASFSHVVYAWQCRNQPYAYVASMIREVYKRFPRAVGIAIDARGGEAILDELAFNVPEGERPLVDKLDEERLSRLNRANCDFVLATIKATDTLNNQWNSFVKGQLESGKLRFPKYTMRKDSDEIREAYNAINEMLYQFISIRTRLSEKTHLLSFFVPNSKKNKKDLYSSMVYAMSLVRERLMGDEKKIVPVPLLAFV